MKRQYPVYTLFIDVPLDTVDVNVHPNKADLRFVNNTLVYGTIYKVISSILDGTAKAADFVIDSTIVPQITSTFGDESEKNKVYSQKEEDANKVSIDDENKITDKFSDNFSDERKPYAAEFNQSKKVYDKSFDDIVGMPQFDKKAEKPVVTNPYAIPHPDYSVYENYEEPKMLDAEKDVSIYRYYDDIHEKNRIKVCNGKYDFMELGQIEEREKQRVAEQQKIEYNSCKYKGELFNTYLLYEIHEDVYIIDQHAAHERLLYNSLREKMANRKVARQGMLVPFILDINAAENEFIESNLPIIRSMGFDIEPFGLNSYRVNEVPVDLQDIDLQKFFDDLLSNLNELKSIKLEDMLKDKIATTACKHAVKGGMSLTEEERAKLFEMLGGDMGLKCPHGRPICVKLTKTQIEKMFKRIV
jgi:DNA mismatch repair protein MutL